MSKMDALRAMREARYAQQSSAQPTPSSRKAAANTTTRSAAKPKPTGRTKPPPDAPVAADDAGEERCGHRNMSGRTCTREQGHSAKSHRYS